MPEYVHRIVLNKRIDLNASHFVRLLGDMKKAKRTLEAGPRGTESLFASLLTRGPGKKIEDVAGALGSLRASMRNLGAGRRALADSSARIERIAASSRGASYALDMMGESAAQAVSRLDLAPLSGASREIEKSMDDVPALFEGARRSVDAFAEASEESLTRFFSGVLDGKISNAKSLFRDLKSHAIRMVRDAAAEMASTQFIKPAVGALKELGVGLLGDLGAGLFKVLGFSRGGLVKKPTLGLIGEAGPELVVPLAKIGGEAGLMRLFSSVAEIEAANRVGGTAIATGVGAEASAKLATRIAAARAAATLQVAFSALEFLEGPKNLRTGARLGLNVAGALPALSGATGLAAFGPAAGAFLLGDVLLNQGGAIKQGLAMLGFKGFLSSATPFTRGIGNLSQAGGLYLALDHFRRTGEAQKAQDVWFPAAVYRSQTNVDKILMRQVGPMFQLIQRAAGRAGISPQEGVRRHFGADVYAAYLKALPLPEGDAPGRFVKRSALRLVGEAGPEHIMNVNHPQSIDFFQRGVRPIIRDAIREEMCGGESHVYHVHVQGGLADERTLEKLARKLEEIARRKRRYGSA